MSDIVCPDCCKKKETKEVEVRRGRGRPSSAVETGQIMIPLHRKGRGRPRKETNAVKEVTRSRGRPHKEVTEDSRANIHRGDQNENEENLDQNGNNFQTGGLDLIELRILGNGNIFSKVFVSEALTCDDAIEAHLYDILEDAERKMPCLYFGEVEQKKLFTSRQRRLIHFASVVRRWGEELGLEENQE